MAVWAWVSPACTAGTFCESINTGPGRPRFPGLFWESPWPLWLRSWRRRHRRWPRLELGLA